MESPIKLVLMIFRFQLMKKMSSTDTPLGTLNMLQAKQKETQSPFVVLSGNKQQQQISKTRR